MPRGISKWAVVAKANDNGRQLKFSSSLRLWGLVFFMSLWGMATQAESLFQTNTTWRLFKGLSEASSPDSTTWRQVNFDDGSWFVAPAPVFYSTAATEPPFYNGDPFGGTKLDDMQFKYSSVYFRKTFVLLNAASISQLTFTAACDDGFVAWINGVEVARVNVPAGTLAHDSFAVISVAEPVPMMAYTITNKSGLLTNGTNVLAIQGFNRSIDSSDFGFMASLDSAGDGTAPTLLALNPPADSSVPSLTQLEVRFSEAVTNVDAADLLVNGLPAKGLSVVGPDSYTFSFNQPATGTVTFAWTPTNGITDLAHNPFVGSSWQCSLDTNLVGGTAIISEFMALNAHTLFDEDGNSSDWIEICNVGSTTMTLDGWFLTDNSRYPTQWRFPLTNLVANARLVVFASGADRSVPGAPLHTNFKLSGDGGYLALMKPDGVTVASAFTYPAQHTDVSYGISRQLNPVPLFGIGSPLRLLVPSNNALGLQWTGGAEPFNDSSWRPATNGVGFDQTLSGSSGLVAWWNFNDASNPNLARDAGAGKHDAVVSNGPVYTSDGGGRTGFAGDRAMKFSGSGAVQVMNAVTAMFSSAVANNAISISLWIYGDASEPVDGSVFWGADNADGTGNRMLNAHLPWTDEVIYWDTVGYDPSLNRVWVSEPDSTKWKGRWNHYVFLKNGNLKEIWQNGTRILSGINTQPLSAVNSFFIGSTGSSMFYSGLIDDFAIWDGGLTATQIQSLATGASPDNLDGFGPLVSTDVGSVMSNKNASAYLRGSFTMTAPPDVNLLLLHINYDDGFVCWLNGVEVSRRNAPSALMFNSTASSERTKTAARTMEEIDLSTFISLLHPGLNEIAIQGLNYSASDPDFLQRFELVSGYSGATVFFPTPTPGVNNATGIAGFTEDPQFSPARGFYTAPVDVLIWTTSPGATLVYTTDGSVPTLSNGRVVAGTNVVVHVATTMALRAAAFKTGYQPSNIGTHSYLFPAQVASQTRPVSIAATWPDGTPAPFPMNAGVISHTLPGYGLTNALLDLPAISLVMPLDQLFGSGGIYANPQMDIEYPGSVEMLFANGQSSIQGNAGLCIRGGSSEANVLTPKHSFTAFFRSIYGLSKLNASLFLDTPTHDFNALVLRGNVLDSWVNSELSGVNHFIDGEYRWYRTRAGYVRDQWMRDSQHAQGQPAGYGRFVNLFLNGYYWGLYNLDEKLDDSWAAQYIGGNAADYDVIHDGELKAGQFDAWNQLLSLSGYDLSDKANYQRLLGNNADGTRNLDYPVLLDVTNLVDYMVLHIYAGADDWPWHNWVASRSRALDSTGFKFMAWDQEISINSLVKQHTADTAELYEEVDSWNCPAYVYAHCRANVEFRQLFADRVQRQFFNGGALTVSNNIARYEARTAEIDHAIVGESARWGDFYRPSQPYLREAEWLGTNLWMRQTFFPSNNTIALKRFRSANLFPSFNAPLLSQFGGAVPNGFALSIANPNAFGTIYFTVDGTDPRNTGGSVASTAQAYSTPVIINAPTAVRARVLYASQWSGVVEAVFYPPQDLSKLCVTEIMYHPPTGGTTNGDEFEFLELKNVGTNALDLSGLTFTAGITYTFTNRTVVAPGHFQVLVRDAAAFTAKYPGMSVNGIYTGKLDNGGEKLTLSHPLGTTVFSVTYGTRAPWPVSPDGDGFSLVPKVSGASQAPDDGAKWRASANVGGSPGMDDPNPGLPQIVINELLTHTDLPQVDSIELFNPTPAPVDIGGWFLTDDPSNPRKYRIANDTTLPALGYVTFNEKQFNPTPGLGNSFSLSSHGEGVYLLSGDASTNLTGYSHGVIYGAAATGVSFGRYLNSAGEEQFPAQNSLTLNGVNSGPRVGPVVISEIQYHPVTAGDEFVELQNITGSAVPLFYPANPGDTWQIGGIAYAFPTNITLAPNGLLLVVGTNAAAFRSKFSVPTNVPVFGPFSGVLDKGGEVLQLQRPDLPDSKGIPYITVDGAGYNNKYPWPSAADGSGCSLQRINVGCYGNDPTNWAAAGPTPGRLFEAADTDGDGLPDWWEIANGTNPSIPDADADPDHDGFTNGQEYLAGTSPTNAGSFLHLDAARAGDGILALRFGAFANHHYTLYSSTNLTKAWQPVFNVLQTTDGVCEVQVKLTNACQFYRFGAP